MEESAKNGIVMNTGCSPKGIKKLDDGSFELTYSGPDGESTKTFDQILMATGRGPNTSNLGLENAGVELDNKGCGSSSCETVFTVQEKEVLLRDILQPEMEKAQNFLHRKRAWNPEAFVLRRM